MATTGHESEAINVQGLKASLQKFKTDKVDGKADKVTVTAGSYNKVTVNSQGVVTAGENPTTLAGHGITDAYTKSETYTKTEVNGLVDTPHQNYVTVQATSQTTDATDVLPASGQSADTIYRVSNWDGSTNSGAGAFDVTKYSEYAWDDQSNPNKYVFLCVKTAIGEVFDISVYNNNATYADLTAALGTNGANVPEAIRKGGMSVKFVQSPDHKYVQYRLMSDTFNTTVANWQSMNADDEPTAGSDNLVKSSGIYNKFQEQSQIIGKTEIDFISGYLMRFSAVGNVNTLIPEENSSYRYAIVNVNEGDIVQVHVTGSSTAGHYEVLDSNNIATRYNIIAGDVDETVIIAENERKIVINNMVNNDYKSYLIKSNSLDRRVSLLENKPDEPKYIINVNELNNVNVYYSDSLSARNAVSNELRKNGLIITYLLKEGWRTEQFIGSDINYWGKDENWQNYTFIKDDRSPNLFNLSDLNGNLLAYFDSEGYFVAKQKENIDFNLPVEINSYVGDTLQLFKYPMTLLSYFSNFNIDYFVDSNNTNIKKYGRNLRRYFEFSPLTTGTFTIKTNIITNTLKTLKEGSFKINVITPTNPSSLKNILLIGDSETAGVTNQSEISVAEGASVEGYYPYANEVKGLLSNREGTSISPAGLNLSNIQLIGSKNTADGRHEGYGGRTPSFFYSSSSPFYKNGAVDFNAYLDQNTIYDNVSKKGVDIIYILLGANNTETYTFDGNQLIIEANQYRTEIKTLLDYIKEQIIEDTSAQYYNPNLKVVLLSYALPWIDGGGYRPNGSNEYSDGTFASRRYLANYKVNNEIANDSDYSSFVSSIMVSNQIDSENAYAYIMKQKNRYMAETELNHIENVHPSDIGYKMYAASVVRDLIGRVNQ